MAQMELFSQPAVAVSPVPTLDTVRVRVETVLSMLREAEVLPWSPKEMARWRLVFPQMTDWLPTEERLERQSEFDALLEGLLAG